MAKPRARRSDDVAVSAEEFEEAGVRVHGLKAVQQKHRPAGAAPHNLQFDPAHLEPLRSVNHHHIPSFSLLRADSRQHVRRILWPGWRRSATMGVLTRVEPTGFLA